MRWIKEAIRRYLTQGEILRGIDSYNLYYEVKLTTKNIMIKKMFKVNSNHEAKFHFVQQSTKSVLKSCWYQNHVGYSLKFLPWLLQVITKCKNLSTESASINQALLWLIDWLILWSCSKRFRNHEECGSPVSYENSLTWLVYY